MKEVLAWPSLEEPIIQQFILREQDYQEKLVPKAIRVRKEQLELKGHKGLPVLKELKGILDRKEPLGRKVIKAIREPKVRKEILVLKVLPEHKVPKEE